MFVDYVPLLLINMAAGLFLLAWYLYKGIEAVEQKIWAPAFAIVGFVALVNGLHMSWTWPLPGSYNVAFGEMSVFFGVLFLAAALAFANNWGLFPIGIYSVFTGIAAVLIGIRIINLKMTQEPIVSGMGFILSGLASIFVGPVLYFKNNRALRIVISFFLIVAGIIWLRTGYKAYWSHLSNLSKWVPVLMR